MKIDWHALKESITDTVIATPLNLAVNFVLLSLFMSFEWSASQISLAMTAIFFVLAVVRKYYVRQWFKRRYKND